jgi:hypothetical protein
VTAGSAALAVLTVNLRLGQWCTLTIWIRWVNLLERCLVDHIVPITIRGGCRGGSLIVSTPNLRQWLLGRARRSLGERLAVDRRRRLEMGERLSYGRRSSVGPVTTALA